MGHFDWLRGRSVHFSTFILFCIIIILYISYYISILKVSCAAQLFTLANTIKCCACLYLRFSYYQKFAGAVSYLIGTTCAACAKEHVSMCCA